MVVECDDEGMIKTFSIHFGNAVVEMLCKIQSKVVECDGKRMKKMFSINFGNAVAEML